MYRSVETLVDLQRPRLLRLARLAGAVHGRASRGWGPLVCWLVIVSVALLLLPPTVNLLLGIVPADVWSWLRTGDPRLGELWSVWNVLGVVAAILTLRWVVQARERVVVEEFVDYSHADGKAVSGLATLLIAELSRLQELYSRVNDELSTPMSVGVGGRGGAGQGRQPGAFLSVSADEVGNTLSDAIATETTVSFGGIKIPIGFVLSVVGRLARGPRVAGSLHFTDAAGGPTLTAQIVGRGQSHQWRVDLQRPAETVDKAFLDAMVTELACRMFNDLTLRGSVRWRAIRAFTEHLDLYWESYRTPRDRAIKLERAEGKLLEAIAEDEGFDLAFYNLGVVYSQLADTEHAAAENSEYVKPSDRPLAAYEARLDAALVAFNRAVALNRDRTEAIYALAVHEFTRLEPGDSDGLEAIVCRCERVLELEPGHAQAHELMGRALIALGPDHAAAGERSLRRAVGQSWRRLWRVEFDERSAPPTVESLLPGARANLASALRKLADVNAELADGNERRRERADRLFTQACELATGDTKAATLWVHGLMLERRGEAARARDRYHEALKIDPENPVYWAHLASGWAADSRAKAERFADGALNCLSPIYRRTLELHHSSSLPAMCESTIGALQRAYDKLGDAEGAARIQALRTLADELETGTRARDTRALRRIKARYGADRRWEREQVQIALARTLGRIRAWPEAVTEYDELIAMLEQHRPDGLVQHSLRAKQARALRNVGKLEEALVAAADGQLQNPLSACARREVGKAHFALLQFEEALGAWEQTLWLTPNDPYLHWKVAFCHWSVAQDRHDESARRAALLEAAEGFEQAALLFGARLVEGWAWSQLWAGRVRQELGEPDAALSHLRSAAGCTPTKLPAELLLGEVYVAVGEYGAGRVELESALEAVTPGTGRKVDADWGETLTDHEIAVRAAVALGRLELDAEGNARKARRRATDARGVTTGITLPAIRARCLASVAELERLAAGGARNGVALNGSG